MVRGLRTQAKPHLWPAPSKTVSGGLKVIEPGEMRKPRWNPNADEWLSARQGPDCDVWLRRRAQPLSGS